VRRCSWYPPTGVCPTPRCWGRTPDSSTGIGRRPTATAASGVRTKTGSGLVEHPWRPDLGSERCGLSEATGDYRRQCGLRWCVVLHLPRGVAARVVGIRRAGHAHERKLACRSMGHPVVALWQPGNAPAVKRCRGDKRCSEQEPLPAGASCIARRIGQPPWRLSGGSAARIRTTPGSMLHGSAIVVPPLPSPASGIRCTDPITHPERHS